MCARLACTRVTTVAALQSCHHQIIRDGKLLLKLRLSLLSRPKLSGASVISLENTAATVHTVHSKLKTQMLQEQQQQQKLQSETNTHTESCSSHQLCRGALWWFQMEPPPLPIDSECTADKAAAAVAHTHSIVIRIYNLAVGEEGSSSSKTQQLILANDGAKVREREKDRDSNERLQDLRAAEPEIEPLGTTTTTTTQQQSIAVCPVCTEEVLKSAAINQQVVEEEGANSEKLQPRSTSPQSHHLSSSVSAHYRHTTCAQHSTTVAC